MARALPVVLTVVFLVSAAVVAVNLPGSLPTADAQAGRSQNDAGSGGDAGDSPAGAVLVSNARRVHTANLTPPGVDADWYRQEAHEAFCSVAQMSASSAGSFTLAGDAAQQLRASRMVEPRRNTELALASPPGGTPYLGFEPGSLFAFSESGGDRSPDPGRYSFGFQTYRLADLDPEGDGESPEAGPAPGASRAIGSGCHAGRVAGVSDAEDWHHLDVSGSRQLTVSFALARASEASLEVRSPTGEVRAVLASGEAADLWAEEGRWHLVVRAPAATVAAPAALALARAAPLAGAADESATDYLIGLTDGPGSSNACRPSCLG